MSLPVAILAGGLATRLRPITANRPKALIELDGRPFAEHQADLLANQGIERVVWLVGYLGEQIESALGDGRRWSMRFEFVHDGPTLLGTGGALRRALPTLGTAFFVMYGDSYLECDFRAVERSFHQSGAAGLMTVFRNEEQFDASNIEFDGHRILRYDKREKTIGMKYIDYGLGVLTQRALEQYPENQPIDLAVVYQNLLAGNELAAFEVLERFYEIGSSQGLLDTERHLRERKQERRIGP